MNTISVVIKDGDNISEMELQTGDVLTVNVTDNGVNISQYGGSGECNIAQGAGAVGKVVNRTTVSQQTIRGNGNVSSGSGSVFVNHFTKK